MDYPDHGHGHRQRRGEPLEASVKALQGKRAVHHAQQEQPGQQVNHQVDDVVAGGMESADEVVDRQRKPPDRTGRAGDDRLEGAQLVDCRIIDDGRQIVEHHRTGEAVVVGQQTSGKDQQRRPGMPCRPGIGRIAGPGGGGERSGFGCHA